MENEVNKRKKKIYFVITIWILIFLVIGGILIAYCLNNNSKAKEKSSVENQESDSTKTTNIIKLEDLGTYKIKLENNVVDVIVSGESTHRELVINNKKIDISLEYVDTLYVMNSELIIISKSLGSEVALYFYDSDINNINANFKYENNYVMKPIDVDKVEKNTLTVTAMNESVLNNYNAGADLNTFCKNINIDDYEGQLSEAEYEIKYLGNGLFGQPQRTSKEKYINEECQRGIDISIDNNKIVNTRSNGTYKKNSEERTIPFTARINSTNAKEVILTANYDSDYVKQVYKEIAESGIKEYTIKFDKNIKQVFIGEGSITTGAGYETVFYLLEDGTIEYTPIAHALGYDFKVYKCMGQINIKSYGKVDQSINSVTDIIHGDFSLDSPYVGAGSITLAKRSDGYWYDLTNFLEKTSYYK